MRLCYVVLMLTAMLTAPGCAKPGAKTVGFWADADGFDLVEIRQGEGPQILVLHPRSSTTAVWVTGELKGPVLEVRGAFGAVPLMTFDETFTSYESPDAFGRPKKYTRVASAAEADQRRAKAEAEGRKPGGRGITPPGHQEKPNSPPPAAPAQAGASATAAP